ncbi:POT family proton-dependent oligopeptide transporter [Kineosphaera limosa]|uniref:Di-/tripeptide transporter n=1 Tax=Kineosphaera limosa NBRC 100340 TaxID=1184609 RepID=K6VHA0_9MICO|nr:oligopeptide:H+ symporter [Kineosphaera limosa]NYD99880.1 POT family proton-dependent oligopeptide transporter [Kineosphaera limosa]GAB95583.1 di-/tripeptide transporter [Kineosphaera limosa NBRC 100340]
MSTPNGSAAAEFDSRQDRGFLGHPGGLSTLFFVELWERFSYYGMRAILVYYLYDGVANGGLGLEQETAQSVVAVYGASVYLLSIVGGLAADRIVGARLSVLYGGIVIMAGHISLAIPGAAFSWIGIALVALGTGLLKPNISAMVGSLYDVDDPRRDGGFQIFYMSINIGAFFAPFVVAFLRERWGYHAGFSAAAVGMGLALVLFVLGRARLRGAGDDVPNPLAPQERTRLILGSIAGIAAFVVVLLLAMTWNTGPVTAAIDAISIVCIITPLIYFIVMFRSPKVTEVERSHLAAYVPLWVGAAMFFMIFEQAAGKMATFAEQNTDLGGWVSPEWYQAINPITIVVLAPLFGWLWTKRAGRFPSTPLKFAAAVLIIGLSALMMAAAFAVYSVEGGANRAPFWVLGTVFVVQTVAELCLSPVGLAATTLLAPRAFASQALALWFLASSAGQAVGAQSIKAMAGLPDSTFYLVVGGITIVISGVLFALVPWTRGKMQDVEDRKLAGAQREAAERH